jgi:MFS transporter, Spinster family, sphingosine-1-phosphate transporter
MGSASAPGSGVPRAANAAYVMLAVLTAMNLLNYVDRYILAAVLGPVQEGLGFADDDAKAGSLSTVFFISYALFSPVVGWLGDRVTRKYLIAGGVAVWSLATFASGWAQNYHQMLLARSILGIGEASYAILAPTLISDLFSRSRRNKALTIFYVAIPVGAAVGYGLGGWLFTLNGDDWRPGFQVVGLPGLFIAFAALFLPEPRRGATELADEGGEAPHAALPLSVGVYLTLARNRSYVLNTLGMAMMTFALGGLQFWAPKYLSLGQGDLPLKEVNFLLGMVVVLSGLIGTLLGGWLADRLAPRLPGAYFLVSGVGMLLSAPLILTALLSVQPVIIFGSIGIGLTLAVFNFGPTNTINVNVIPPRIRAAGIAVNLFLLHLLGDIPSPYVMGAVSDWTQTAGIAATRKEGLFLGVALTVPALLLSGLFFCLGARFLKGDQETVLREMRSV